MVDGTSLSGEWVIHEEFVHHERVVDKSSGGSVEAFGRCLIRDVHLVGQFIDVGCAWDFVKASLNYVEECPVLFVGVVAQYSIYIAAQMV